MAFCTSCGTELRGDGRFCTGCGSPRPAANAPAAPVVHLGSQAELPTPVGPQFSVVAGIWSIAAGMLALLASLLPNQFDGLFGFWQDFRLLSVNTGLIVGLIGAGVCALVLGPRHPHWLFGCVAACTTFLAILLQLHLASVGYLGLFRIPRAGGAFVSLAAACAVAAAAVAVVVNARAGCLKITVDSRFAGIGFAAGGTLGVWTLVPDFGSPFVNVQLGSGDVWSMFAILIWTLALAGTVVLGALIGLRACIATSGVVLSILVFYFLSLISNWPGGPIAVGMPLVVISTALLVTLIVRSATLLQTEAQRSM